MSVPVACLRAGFLQSRDETNFIQITARTSATWLYEINSLVHENTFLSSRRMPAQIDVNEWVHPYTVIRDGAGPVSDKYEHSFKVDKSCL